MFSAPARFQLVPNPHQVSESTDFLSWGAAHRTPAEPPHQTRVKRAMFNNFTQEGQHTQQVEEAEGMNFTMLSRMEAKENSSIFCNLQNVSEPV
jgi:hypothetical protein